ncbi:hypothetical protein CH337_17090 [Rhodoblastus acidophilus]|nr:hypothetical protein CKO16_20540 [Rhodoblastus acidophilus]RAI17285.1 hypothetical protein CH337_17090 [Rhodoblastus acidophilus]
MMTADIVSRSWSNSIQARMTLVIIGFCFLVASVTSFSIVGLRTIDARMRSIAQFGVVETQFFGQLADHLPDLRLAEVLLERAENERERAEVLADLGQQREFLGRLAEKMDAIPADRINAALRDQFRAAWADYAALHDRQFSAGADHRVDASLRNPIHQAFIATEEAMDRLIADNQDRIEREVAAANALSQSMMMTMIAAALVASLTSLVLYLRARRNIFSPLSNITRALTALARGRTDIELPKRPGRDEIARLTAAYGVFRSNLAELKHAHGQAKVAHRAAEAMAHQDPLTKLPNRRALASKLCAFFGGDHEADNGCALLIVDLDRFKPVNDLHGHMVGDLVLCAVAERLRTVAPPKGLAVRIGGDEFAMIMPLTGDNPQPACALAERIIEALRPPIFVGDLRVEIGASIGVALSKRMKDPAGLLSAGDIAMYRAKKSQDSICLFEPEMEVDARRHAELENALRRALAAGEIAPHYQPIVDLDTRKLRGFEILARWRDPQLGQVSPEIFIPVAERRGLILNLFADLLAQACLDAAHWPQDLVLSMNVSPSQLRHIDFPEELLARLHTHGFAPDKLEIEITETALIGDVDAVRDVIRRLRAAGVKVALDDFGMGFSSLNHLRQFKIDKVKIDRSFTKIIFDDPESAFIVQSVIHLAHGLNLKVVAEGIEDERTAEMIRLMGCDLGQGYHFGKALAGPDAAALVARVRAAHGFAA